MEVIDPRNDPSYAKFCFDLRLKQLKTVIDELKKKIGKDFTKKKKVDGCWRGTNIYFRYRNNRLNVAVGAGIDIITIPVPGSTVNVDFTLQYPLINDFIKTFKQCERLTGRNETVWQFWVADDTLIITPQDDAAVYQLQAIVKREIADKYFKDEETDTMKKTKTKKAVAKKANQETAKAVRKKIAEKCGEKFVSDHVIVMSMPEPKKVKPKAKRKEVKKETKRTPKTENRITDYTGIVLCTDPPKIKEEVKIPTVKAERKLNRTELGECMASNQTMELYRNEELKRYRLAFNRRLTQEERDYLWNHKWTWRREFKCYQWGCTKNGAKECEEVIEYFKNR